MDLAANHIEAHEAGSLLLKDFLKYGISSKHVDLPAHLLTHRRKTADNYSSAAKLRIARDVQQFHHGFFLRVFSLTHSGIHANASRNQKCRQWMASMTTLFRRVPAMAAATNANIDR